jgi:hypothetical protein
VLPYLTIHYVNVERTMQEKHAFIASGVFAEHEIFRVRII